MRPTQAKQKKKNQNSYVWLDKLKRNFKVYTLGVNRRSKLQRSLPLQKETEESIYLLFPVQVRNQLSYPTVVAISFFFFLSLHLVWSFVTGIREEVMKFEKFFRPGHWSDYILWSFDAQWDVPLACRTNGRRRVIQFAETGLHSQRLLLVRSQ